MKKVYADKKTSIKIFLFDYLVNKEYDNIDEEFEKYKKNCFLNKIINNFQMKFWKLPEFTYCKRNMKNEQQ